MPCQTAYTALWDALAGRGPREPQSRLGPS